MDDLESCWNAVRPPPEHPALCVVRALDDVEAVIARLAEDYWHGLPVVRASVEPPFWTARTVYERWCGAIGLPPEPTPEQILAATPTRAAELSEVAAWICWACWSREANDLRANAYGDPIDWPRGTTPEHIPLRRAAWEDAAGSDSCKEWLEAFGRFRSVRGDNALNLEWLKEQLRSGRAEEELPAVLFFVWVREIDRAGSVNRSDGDCDHDGDPTSGGFHENS